jgi:hypothetical protein
MTDTDRTTEYLIWSHEHGGWWKPARRGYSGNLWEAGLYDAADAQQICDGANWRWRRTMADTAPNEVAVPLPVDFASRGIDDVRAELTASIDAATKATVNSRNEANSDA